MPRGGKREGAGANPAKEETHMKLIEKETNQTFEVYTSRKEFSEMVKMLAWGTRNSGIWEDEDNWLELIYKDGTHVLYTAGDTMKPLRLHDVAKGRDSYGSYNCEIVYNEHYEDWEVKIDA